MTALLTAGGTFYWPIAEPLAIDPYDDSEMNGGGVAKSAFVGPMTLDPSGDLTARPAVAEHWNKERGLHPVDLQSAPQQLLQR